MIWGFIVALLVSLFANFVLFHLNGEKSTENTKLKEQVKALKDMDTSTIQKEKEKIDEKIPSDPVGAINDIVNGNNNRVRNNSGVSSKTGKN